MEFEDGVLIADDENNLRYSGIGDEENWIEDTNDDSSAKVLIYDAFSPIRRNFFRRLEFFGRASSRKASRRAVQSQRH